jgi:hypothetical protein
MQMADDKLDLENKLDNELFQHIAYVSNQILLKVKTEGLTSETKVFAGKLLWRLFNVVQAYNAKRREASLEDLLQIVGDFRKVFVGT